MRITAEAEPLAAVLCRGEFVIPRYQRPYAWKPENVRSLLDDIAHCINGGESRHFFGTIMLSPISKNKWAIMDGQQRIVTFSLICAYLCKSFSEEGHSIGENKAMRVMFNIDEMHSRALADAARLSPRVVMSTGDKSNYESLMRGETIRKNGTMTLAWQEIERFFQSPEHQPRNARKKFFDCLLNNLPVAWIEFKDADPLTIFETENTRSKPLDQIQLACVYFYSCTRDQEILADKLHEEIDEIRRCMDNNEERFFAYARCFAQCRHGRLSSDRFARDLREKTVKSPDETLDMVHSMSLRHNIQIFKTLARINSEREVLEQLAKDARYKRGKIGDYLDDLRDYKVSQPVLFALLRMHMEADEGAEKSQAAKFVCNSSELIWAFIQRAAHSFSASFSPSQYEAGVAELARQITRGDVRTAAAFFKELQQWDKKQEIIPDSLYKERMRTIRFPSGLSVAKQILKRINQTFPGDPPTGQGTTEHILPKSKRHLAGWDFADDEHALYAHRLGNLTLIENKNRETRDADNASFAVKKRVYEKSAYEITRRLCEHETWDKAAVDKRQANLAKLAAAVWRLRVD